jgi:hypothetical protein
LGFWFGFGTWFLWVFGFVFGFGASFFWVRTQTLTHTQTLRPKKIKHQTQIQTQKPQSIWVFKKIRKNVFTKIS